MNNILIGFEEAKAAVKLDKGTTDHLLRVLDLLPIDEIGRPVPPRVVHQVLPQHRRYSRYRPRGVCGRYVNPHRHHRLPVDVILCLCPNGRANEVNPVPL